MNHESRGEVYLVGVGSQTRPDTCIIQIAACQRAHVNVRPYRLTEPYGFFSIPLWIPSILIGDLDSDIRGCQVPDLTIVPGGC